MSRIVFDGRTGSVQEIVDRAEAGPAKVTTAGRVAAWLIKRGAEGAAGGREAEPGRRGDREARSGPAWRPWPPCWT